jgi:pyruvate dehydrogenase E2 component (dihydrolipoamide acetyltransferase)
MAEVRMPQFGMGITEVQVVRWLKAVGDRVEEDEPLIEIETAKSVTEVGAPMGGTVAELLAAPGDTVEVYAVVGHIDED